MVALIFAPTRSGARYVSPQEDGYVWRTKKPEAMLHWLAAGQEQVIYKNCREH